MRTRPPIGIAVVTVVMMVSGCGEVAPATTALPTSVTTATVVEMTSTTTQSVTAPQPTTAAPTGPTVVWREVLALGSQVAIRHLAVSNGTFLAVAEADRLIPSEVSLAAFLSPDGEDWAAVELPPEQFAGAVLLELAGGPAGFVAIGTEIDEENHGSHSVWTSPDGATWNQSELEINLQEATSPYVVTVGDLYSVAVTENSFLIAGQTRRYLDTEAIIADHQPDFEWPEFPFIATEILDAGEVRLTIGGNHGSDFVTTFSSLGIDPEEFPVTTMETDWFTVPVESLLWTSTNGIDWRRQTAPNMTQHPGTWLPMASTAFGVFVHGWEEDPGVSRSWHRTGGSDWVEVDLPGRPVVDWSGGLYAFDAVGRTWLSDDGLSWRESTGPAALVDSRELRPAVGTSDSVIAVTGVRPDATWQDATTPEAWVAVSTDGATWYEADGIAAYGMPIWPEAVASSGGRVVIGLVGEPPSAMPQTYLWLGKVSDP